MKRCSMCGLEHNGTYGSRCEDCYAICQDYQRPCGMQTQRRKANGEMVPLVEQTQGTFPYYGAKK